MLNAQKVFTSSKLSTLATSIFVFANLGLFKLLHNNATAYFHSFPCQTCLPDKPQAIQYTVDTKTAFVCSQIYLPLKTLSDSAPNVNELFIGYGLFYL